MSFAISELIKKRDDIVEKRKTMLNVFDKEINDYNKAISILTGKSVAEVEYDMDYDDQSPDYIKGTEDGI